MAPIGRDREVAIVYDANAADALRTLGRCAEAMPLLAAALETWDRTDPDNPGAATVLTTLGACRVAIGQPGKAVEPLERAVRLRETQGDDPVDLTGTRRHLADALWDSGRDRHRAVVQMEKARQELTARGAEAADQGEAVERWLAAHPAPGGPSR